MPINLNSGVIDDVSVNHIANVTQVPSVTAQAGLRSVPSLVLNFAGNVYYSSTSRYAYSAAGLSGYSFTRSSGGYAENVDGSLTYFAGTRTNLNLQSQTLENASWTKTGTSVSANVTIAPDGTLTADKLTEDTANSGHSIASFTPVSGTAYSFSIYAKAAEKTKLTFFGGGFGAQGFTATFDLTNGTMFNNAGGKASISSSGNGWYRCVVTFTPSATGIINYNLISDTNTTPYTGDGVSGLYLWGAQVETTTNSLLTYPTAYIPTTTAAVSVDTPRITNKGYLSEEARTNSIVNSTATNGAVAGVIGSGGALPTNWGTLSPTGITITVIGTGTELGLPYVDIRFSGTATSTAYIEISCNATTAIAASAGQVWTGTSYAKLVSGTLPGGASIWGQTQQAFNAVSLFLSQQFQSGTISSTFARNSGATLTMPATTAYAKTVLSQSTSTANGTVVDFTIRIGAPQMELGAFATSYIPTTTAAATRAADVLKITGNFMGSGPWTWLTDVASVPNQPGIYPTLGNFYLNSSNYLTVYAPNGAASGTALNLNLKIAGSDVWNIPQAGFTTGTAKIGMALISGNVYGSVNGSTSTSLGTNTVFAPVQISIGYGGSANQVNGYVRGMTVWNTQFSTAQLQAITA